VNTKSNNAEIQAHTESEKNHRPEESAGARIRDLVQRFRVCWSVRPEECFVDGTKRKIGFALELCGTHELGTLHVSPGCEHCRPVQAALKEIANWILPRESVRRCTTSISIIKLLNIPQRMETVRTSVSQSESFTGELLNGPSMNVKSNAYRRWIKV
jgi:hypothetical protein